MDFFLKNSTVEIFYDIVSMDYCTVPIVMVKIPESQLKFYSDRIL